MATMGSACQPGSRRMARGFESVHDRHLHVHQHKVVAPARAFEGVAIVNRDIDGQPGAMENLQRDLAIDDVVFDQQQVGAAVASAQHVLRSLACGSGVAAGISPARAAAGR